MSYNTLGCCKEYREARAVQFWTYKKVSAFCRSLCLAATFRPPFAFLLIRPNFHQELIKEPKGKVCFSRPNDNACAKVRTADFSVGIFSVPARSWFAYQTMRLGLLQRYSFQCQLVSQPGRVWNPLKQIPSFAKVIMMRFNFLAQMSLTSISG